jgi:hypothetical protein
MTAPNQPGSEGTADRVFVIYIEDNGHASSADEQLRIDWGTKGTM